MHETVVPASRPAAARGPERSNKGAHELKRCTAAAAALILLLRRQHIQCWLCPFIPVAATALLLALGAWLLEVVLQECSGLQGFDAMWELCLAVALFCVDAFLRTVTYSQVLGQHANDTEDGAGSSADLMTIVLLREEALQGASIWGSADDFRSESTESIRSLNQPGT